MCKTYYQHITISQQEQIVQFIIASFNDNLFADQKKL